ncbi:hypothetical protein [Crocosphaera sp. XPORK-15E]|uniref:hypothetical protein n=1 Tax=Crocosphaera sp. XPORK-15E TaxID=3110247 RepID=UPI002B1F8117|nr:hypothetical protein [Crocosphaera sp. XPORK-15E]MEA5534685.1 hypothetical protein [Crocosphaera sp. XPORK-15E]
MVYPPALVSHNKIVGSWISNIDVYHPDSVVGGQEIWGLPKEMAEFSWQDNQVIACLNNQILCQLKTNINCYL